MPLPVAAAMALKIGVPAVMGAMGGKGRSKNPQMQSYQETSQRTPWDFDPSTSGNQGQMLLANLLNSYGGLLGHATQQFQQRPPSQLGNMLGRMTNEFYDRRV